MAYATCSCSFTLPTLYNRDQEFWAFLSNQPHDNVAKVGSHRYAYVYL